MTGDPVTFRCPIHGTRLESDGPDRLVGCRCGDVFPVRDGIPILLVDPAERDRMASTDWSATASADASPAAFYNTRAVEPGYMAEEHGATAEEIRGAHRTAGGGPALEIGSGRGAFQGTGEPYVALDYSLTALRRFIDGRHVRVCASAAYLPFPDAAFQFVFSMNCLEHVFEVDRAFAEIDRVLAPGGSAWLKPAWHCEQYNCDGLSVRSYRDLTLRQMLTKASLPVRRTIAFKAARALPGRLVRRTHWATTGRGPTRMGFDRLRPEYGVFWNSDSDAVSRIDAHEACMFFQSRGYDVLAPGASALRQLLVRHVPILVRKRAIGSVGRSGP